MVRFAHSLFRKFRRRFRDLVRGQPDWVSYNEILLPCFKEGISPALSKVILNGGYEKKELKIVEEHLESSDVVLELGAGIGFISSACARKIGSERVFALEANPTTCELARETHKKNQVHPRLEQIVLGPVAGTVDFFMAEDYWESSLHPGRDGMKAIKVKQVVANEYLNRISPSFLIVDIEGGESDFFECADLSQISKICLEIHPDIIGNSGVSKVFTKIMSQGFSINFESSIRNVFLFYRDQPTSG